MGSALLPRSTGHSDLYGVDEAGVVVGDHQLHSRESTGDQGTQEGEPAGAGLCGGRVESEDLAVAL